MENCIIGAVRPDAYEPTPPKDLDVGEVGLPKLVDCRRLVLERKRSLDPTFCDLRVSASPLAL
jgi:hypothetical protein